MSYNPIPSPLPVSQSGTWTISVSTSLPAGGNNIGSVTVANPTLAVTQSGTWNTSVVNQPETDLLLRMLAELQTISMLLQIGLGIKDEADAIRNDILTTLQ